MKRSTRALAVTAAFAALALTGCASRQIDRTAADAQPVPGAANLYWICLPEDPGTALYFTDLESSGEDDYEYIVYEHDGCMRKYGLLPAEGQEGAAPAPQPSATNVPSSDEGPRRQEFDDEFSDGDD